MEKFMHEVYWKDVNLRSCLYRGTAAVSHLSVYSPPNVDVGENDYYGEIVKFDEAVKGDYRPTKTGERFGPSWTTHWFDVRVDVPGDWGGGEVHFLWDCECEGLLWWEDGRPMQAFTGGDGCDRRAEFILTKNARGGETFHFYVEAAANHMFGNDAGGIGPPTADRYFTLKKCEIGLFCRNAWDLFYDLEVIYV